jgi:translation elongation factor EF-1alpha
VIKIEEGTLIGKVTHYYNRIGVAVLDLVSSLKLGDTVRIVGGTNTDFTQTVKSMEIKHKKIKKAKPGDDVALKVCQIARKGYEVYKI